MDTVFPKTDAFQKIIVKRDGTLKGPGVADMKGGIIVMLNALRALHAQGALDESNISILLNSDEEIGSLDSRTLIEKMAKSHDIAFVFEATYRNRMVRKRKGLGQARMVVRGRESHAGAAHQEGVSANIEMAHKVLAMEALTDYDKGSTVNVGVLQGGEKRNTIPGCASAYIDMRFTSQKEGEALQEALQKIAANTVVKNANHPDLPTVELWAKLHRPIKAENTIVDALIVETMALSKILGEPIVGTKASGGGTDGSIMQNAGLATLDTLGVDGSGAHSNRENTSVASLIARTKLAAVMLSRQLQSKKD